MNNEEAINFLKGMQNQKQDYADVVGAPAWAKGKRYVYPEPEDYAIDIAISAIEKQIPNKPLKTNYETGIRYTDSYRCPSCNGAFSATGIADYCYHCGQKLDWSDND